MNFIKTNSWLKLFLAFIIILSYTNNIDAQTYAVGNTNVSSDIGQLGNATANIPIYCPPGRQGIKPQLSLSFNSQASIGILGKGWNITGMSVISRSGSNWHLDNGAQETVKLDATDKLTFDGQRLLLVQGSTNSFFTNGNIFRTEIDQFVKVTYKNTGGNEYFEVDTKDGGKAFYGYSADSKHKPVSSNNILSWYITKSYDRNGNFMEYIYDNTNGEILLKQIKYTGYDATFNGTKTSSVAQEAPFNRVEFAYENTTYEGNQYINGEKIIQKNRLHYITTYADATLARTYSMNYDSDDLNSYLKKVTEQNGNGEQLKPVDITWTEDGGLERSVNYTATSENNIRYTGDFNGDGKADLLIIKGILKPEDGTLLSTNNQYEILNFTGGSTLVNSQLAVGSLPHNNISAVMVGDIDSDGDDDIVFQTFQGTSFYTLFGQNIYNNSATFDYYALISSSNKQNNTFSLAKNIKNGSEVCYYPKRILLSQSSSLLTNVYKTLNIKPMLVEADGDGYLDLLEFENYSNNPNNIWPKDNFINISILLSNKSNESLLANRYFKYAAPNTFPLGHLVDIMPMDFNGNGKTDLLLVFDENNGTYSYSYSEIWEYFGSNGVPSLLYSSQFPTKYNKFLQRGDFNGDSKTDLLYFIDSKWMIAYSNGNSFTEFNATDLWFLHNYNPDWCGARGFKLEIADVNGDGKEDIVERHFHITGTQQGINPDHDATYLNIYYSKGFGFKKVNSGSHFNIYSRIPTSEIDNLKNVIGDFDGDGKADFLLFEHNISDGKSPTNSLYLLESFKGYNSKLTKIAYSDKHSYNFTYKSLSADNGTNYSRTNTTYIGKSVSIKPSIYVINTFNIKVNGILDKTTSYQYADLLYNKHGRGLLGFTKITIIDDLTNGVPNVNKQILINESKLNDEVLFKLDLFRSSSYLVANGSAPSLNNLVSQSLYSSSSINTVETLNPNIRFFYSNSTVETNYLTGVKKSTCIEYDENGNVIHTQETFDKVGNATGIPEFTNTSDFKYNQYGSWLPSSVTISRNCKIRKGSSPYYTQTEMAYWSNGNLKHTEYFKNNLSYYYKEVITYDKYGNIIITSLDSANNATTNTFRNKYFTYVNGLFLQKVKNALNQETQFVYEPVYGNKVSEQGPGGLTTTYEYDSWGKLIKTNLPGGNYETVSFNWASTNTDNIYYYVIKSNTLGNMNWEYYNALDQKVMYTVKGFEGQIATQKFTYNSDNILETETNLYDATNSTTIANTKKLTEYTYDKYKRKETVKYNNVLMATYIYDYGTTKTTIKDGKNREKYSILNASGLIETSGDNGGTILYKYGSHNQVIETSTNGSTIFTDYNVQLNKISMTDPNTGTILYDYNAFGDLIGQKDAKNFSYYFKYDELGRLIQKWGGDDVYSYTYYSSMGNASVNQLQKEEFKINGISKHKKEYTYTALGLLSSAAETVNNQVYTTYYDYKSTNQQLYSVSYPTGITLTYDYDNFNNLKKITNAANNIIIWNKNSEDVDGKITSESYGNGFTTSYSYDTHRQLSEINSINNSNSQVALKVNYDFELQTGNLLHRYYNDVTDEEFSYDNLDRLVKIEETINGSGNVKTYNYENNGNITSIDNGGLQTLQYGGSQPNALTGHKFENVNQTVPIPSLDVHDYVYTTFDKISHIEQNAAASLNIDYGLDQQRIAMQVMEYNNPSIESYYINSANVEIKNGVSYTYLYAQGKPFAIYNGNTEELYYLHLDYQGSLMAITSDNGTILEQRSYDAWGRPRDPITWSYNLGMAFGGAGQGITMRGYTMHEHLEMFSLINMNGRLYDPILGRMLSPDNYIQSLDNTQSYNRYSYCINNPLKYTDPDGQWFIYDDVAAMLIGGAINWAVNGARFDGKGLAYFGVGALAGEATLYMGMYSGGATAGAITGAGNAWIDGKSGSEIIISGMAGAALGLALAPIADKVGTLIGKTKWGQSIANWYSKHSAGKFFAGKKLVYPNPSQGTGEKAITENNIEFTRTPEQEATNRMMYNSAEYGSELNLTYRNTGNNAFEQMRLYGKKNPDFSNHIDFKVNSHTPDEVFNSMSKGLEINYFKNGNGMGVQFSDGIKMNYYYNSSSFPGHPAIELVNPTLKKGFQTFIKLRF